AVPVARPVARTRGIWGGYLSRLRDARRLSGRRDAAVQDDLRVRFARRCAVLLLPVLLPCARRGLAHRSAVGRAHVPAQRIVCAVLAWIGAESAHSHFGASSCAGRDAATDALRSHPRPLTSCMTITILLFAASALFALLAIHPFLTYPLSLWLLARRSRPESAGPARGTQAERLTIPICLCAYNEESVIRQKAQNLLALRRRTPDVELLVYIDAATDATAERLAEFGDNIDVYVSK